MNEWMCIHIHTERATNVPKMMNPYNITVTLLWRWKYKTVSIVKVISYVCMYVCIDTVHLVKVLTGILYFLFQWRSHSSCFSVSSISRHRFLAHYAVWMFTTLCRSCSEVRISTAGTKYITYGYRSSGEILLSFNWIYTTLVNYFHEKPLYSHLLRSQFTFGITISTVVTQFRSNITQEKIPCETKYVCWVFFFFKKCTISGDVSLGIVKPQHS